MIDPETFFERHRGRTISYDIVRLPDRRSTFRAALLEITDRHIVLMDRVRRSEPLVVDGERVIDAGFWMVWFLYKDRPWDIGRFYTPAGELTGHYVDVLEPVRWRGDDGASLEPIVDLFLDIWIAPNGRPTVLDRDEMHAAARDGSMSREQVAHAESVLTALLESIEKDTFPPPLVRDFAFDAI